MVLLELTQQEAEVLGHAIILKEIALQDELKKSIGKTTLEGDITRCHSLWSKLDKAKHPQQDVLITSKDLFRIICMAKEEYLKLGSETYISEKEVPQNELVHISLASAVISWLNSKNLLKRLARFDFTDSSCKYEETTE